MEARLDSGMSKNPKVPLAAGERGAFAIPDDDAALAPPAEKVVVVEEEDPSLARSRWTAGLMARPTDLPMLPPKAAGLAAAWSEREWKGDEPASVSSRPPLPELP